MKILRESVAWGLRAGELGEYVDEGEEEENAYDDEDGFGGEVADVVRGRRVVSLEALPLVPHGPVGQAQTSADNPQYQTEDAPEDEADNDEKHDVHGILLGMVDGKLYHDLGFLSRY
ncbi:hypothetical protein H6758_01185 [Candidatus Nomurabacteria bacterium]|nr:hypothetical protein [Candidatus Nomurabacteria bacterium]